MCGRFAATPAKNVGVPPPPRSLEVTELASSLGSNRRSAPRAVALRMHEHTQEHASMFPISLPPSLPPCTLNPKH